MERKDHIDLFGATALVAFSIFIAFNQVVIKVVNEGFQPVFFAGIRSLGGALLVWLWIVLREGPVRIAPGTAGAGLLIGTIFAAEFLCLFLALDLTTVTRTSVIFYSMPVWLALGAHLLLPGERITPRKAAGLTLAFAGVAWAILDRADPSAGEASLAGDLFALGGAIGWAGIALCARGTALVRVAPQMQLLWQLGVSAPLLLLVAPLFGPLTRDPGALAWAGLGFQIVAVASAGFLFWLWLLSKYPASGVASFSFLSPIFGILLGWWLLGEPVGPALLASGALVAAGLVLINRPPRVRAVT